METSPFTTNCQQPGDTSVDAGQAHSMDTPSSAEELISNYNDVLDCFSYLPGELHLKDDSSIWPIQELPRRIPIPIKAKVTRAIKKEF